HCGHIGQLGTEEAQTTSHVIFATEAVGFLLQPVQYQELFIRFIFCIEAQLTGSGHNPLLTITVLTLPAVMTPYPRSGLRPGHFNPVPGTTSVLSVMRCINIHFIARQNNFTAGYPAVDRLPADAHMPRVGAFAQQHGQISSATMPALMMAPPISRSP